MKRNPSGQSFSQRLIGASLSLVLVVGLAPSLQGCVPATQQTEAVEQLSCVTIKPKSDFALDSETATVTLQTNAVLVDSIDASNVSLSGKFDDYTIQSVNRDNDSELSIVLVAKAAEAASGTDEETVYDDGSNDQDPEALEPADDEAKEYWEAVHAGTEGDATTRMMAEICYGASVEDSGSDSGSDAAGSTEGNVTYDLHNDDTAGGIYLTAATFANCDRAASVIVNVVEAVGSLHPEDGSWDEQAGEILLPFDLGEAEFNKTPGTSNVTISDPNIKVTAIELDPSGKNAAVLHIEAPADKAQALVSELDTALTESGIIVSGDVTNVGSVAVVSDDVEQAKAQGTATTALECIAPNITAKILDVNISDSELTGKSTSQTVDVLMDTEFTASVGSVDLNRASGDQVGTVTRFDGTTDILSPEVRRTGTTSAQLTDTEERTYVDLKADDGACDTAEEAKQAAIEAAEIANAHVIHLASGTVLDGWGIPRDGIEVYITYDSDSMSQVADGTLKQASFEDAVDAFCGVEEAYADESSALEDSDAKYEKAEGAFDIMKGIFEAAGRSLSAGMEGDAGELVSSVGSYADIMSNILGMTAPTGETIQDVYKEVSDLNDRVSELQAEVPALSVQLSAVQKDLAYRDDLKPLAEYSIQASNLQAPLAKYFDGVDWSDLDKTIKYIAEGDYAKDLAATQATDANRLDKAKKMDSLYKTLQAEDASKTRPAVTLVEELGNLITGNKSLYQKSVIDDCYEYIDTMYNWEPETYADKKAYLAYMGKLYFSAYMAATFENVYSYKVAKTADEETYELNLSKIKASFDAVKGVFGIDESNKVGAESSQMAATHADASDTSHKVKNLVNGKVYSPSTFGKSIFGDPSNYTSWVSLHPSETKNPPCMDVTISTADFETMAARRTSNSVLKAKYSNLWEEMKDMGLGVTQPGAFTAAKRLDVCRAYGSEDSSTSDSAKRVIFLTDTSLNYSHTDKADYYHDGKWTGNCYDVVNECAMTNSTVMYEHRYYPGVPAHWYAQVSIYILFNSPAA